MFFLSYHVIPEPDSKHAADIAGAYVNCWIDFKDGWGARRLAELAIIEERWIIKTLDRELETGREFYTGDEDDFQYFEEAEKNGWSFVYHTYGHDAPDRDDEE